MRGSDLAILAVDATTQRLVGFITAITDGAISAYIPFLEVRPEYQAKGIGTQLVKRMLRRLGNFYMIDLVCDPGYTAFYKHFGMRESTAMSIRNYEKLNGRETHNASRPPVTAKIH